MRHSALSQEADLFATPLWAHHLFRFTSRIRSHFAGLAPADSKRLKALELFFEGLFGRKARHTLQLALAPWLVAGSALAVACEAIGLAASHHALFAQTAARCQFIGELAQTN